MATVLLLHFILFIYCLTFSFVFFSSSIPRGATAAQTFPLDTE